MTAPRFTDDAADDAVKDALALLRAALQDDRRALATVGAHLSSPHLTSMVLASWLADLTAGEGTAPDEALARLDGWQRGAGLG